MYFSMLLGMGLGVLVCNGCGISWRMYLKQGYCPDKCQATLTFKDHVWIKKDFKQMIAERDEKYAAQRRYREQQRRGRG